jgi:hypothetical protein
MNRLLLFLVLSSILKVFALNCPNQCSSHGTCNTFGGTCSCFTSYTGTDCSIYQQDLQYGVWLSGSLNIWQWHYFKVSTGFGTGALRFELKANGSDNSGDCDLYLKFGDRPTRLSYDFKDSSPTTDSIITINRTQYGSYYAGVYAFYGCSYSIRVDPLGSCATPCVHGVCRNGACVCDAGYSGPTCDNSNEKIELGRQYASSVSKNEWKYYMLELNSPHAVIDVILNQTDTREDADCDLYARFGTTPTQFDWDYFDQNWRENLSKVSLVEPQQGNWYIGIFGFNHCTFTIKATTSAASCINKCTKRGDCNRGSCSCRNGYDGNYCEEKKDNLSNGEIVNGYVEYLTWNYYKVSTSSANSLVVHVEQNEALADCDIYAKLNDWPNQTSYDYFEMSYNKIFNITINDAGVGTWYFSIFGVSRNVPCSYNMTTLISSTCVSCVHGTCEFGGYCYCRDGWGGTSCDTPIRKLTENVPFTSSVDRGFWNYYLFKTNGTTAFVVLKEKNTVGHTWLFANRDYTPDLRYHDYSDKDTKKSFHALELNFNNFWRMEVCPSLQRESA